MWDALMTLILSLKKATGCQKISDMSLNITLWDLTHKDVLPGASVSMCHMATVENSGRL